MSESATACEAVQHSHVLVVQIDIHVAVQLAAIGEELRARAGMRLREGAQDLAHRGARRLELGLPPVWARSTGGIFTVGIRVGNPMGRGMTLRC